MPAATVLFITCAAFVAWCVGYVMQMPGGFPG